MESDFLPGQFLASEGTSIVKSGSHYEVDYRFPMTVTVLPSQFDRTRAHSSYKFDPLVAGVTGKQ